MTGELTGYWAARTAELAKFFGVVPHVQVDGHETATFFLGNYEALQLNLRSSYVVVSYTDWDRNETNLKSQTFSEPSLIAAAHFVIPTIIENLNFNRQSIKILKAII